MYGTFRITRVLREWWWVLKWFSVIYCFQWCYALKVYSKFTFSKMTLPSSCGHSRWCSGGGPGSRQTPTRCWSSWRRGTRGPGPSPGPRPGSSNLSRRRIRRPNVGRSCNLLIEFHPRKLKTHTEIKYRKSKFGPRCEQSVRSNFNTPSTPVVNPKDNFSSTPGILNLKILPNFCLHLGWDTSDQWAVTRFCSGVPGPLSNNVSRDEGRKNRSCFIPREKKKNNSFDASVSS